ncbi:MAG TPA: penicillin-binding protein 2 [Bacteroidota bacterium]|nr:penicillin-binding protein 2 [Bacteroidota bacterium]
MIEEEDFRSPSRYYILVAITAVCFSILFLRLYQLQLLYHSEYGKKSEENSARTIVQEPVRGYIYDRHGRLVVDDGPSYSITVIPASFDTTDLPMLCSILKMDSSAVMERITRGKIQGRFTPVRLKRDVDVPTLAAIEEHLYLLQGVGCEIESKRIYPDGARAPHLLGYCKEISDAQLAKFGSAYHSGDIIGSTGLEASYEPFLRGEKGYQFVAVNSKGQLLGPLEGGKRDVPSKEGFDLLLSLDLGLQMYAESLLVDQRGAIVAMDPDDGGILAMVSKPDFDPEVFSGVTPASVWTQLNTDPGKPLFNRVTMTRYPPGSTFKMLVAAAALQDGIIDENFRISCPGFFRYGNKIFNDERARKAHGSTNVVEAIQRSCDVFFYQLVLKVGLDRLSKYAKQFGFGELTGIDVGEEVASLVPSPEYYDHVYGKGKWTQGFVVSLGIGQGEVGVSPIQMARYASVWANGGTLQQPHAVNAIRNKRTNRIETIEHKSKSVEIKPEIMAMIREGMRRAVNEAGGTGGAARVPGIVVAGKTGTAQNSHGKDHAWFIGFAPFDHPKIAVAVIVENVGFGGTFSAPIAGKIIQRYLTTNFPPDTMMQSRTTQH